MSPAYAISGRLAGEHYFEMFDGEAIRDELLAPLGPGGDRRYRTQIMDVSGRTPIDSGVHVAPDDAILVADGGFQQKPALSPHWDLRVIRVGSQQGPRRRRSSTRPGFHSRFSAGRA
jgi:hypothetical protein